MNPDGDVYYQETVSDLSGNQLINGSTAVNQMRILADKKRRERAYVSKLLEAVGLAEQARVTERESPDFLVTTPDRRIGIEVTEIYRDKGDRKDRRWEGACESVIEAAQHCWLKADLPTVHVSIAFAASARLPKSEWSNWGRRAVEMVQAALPEEGKQSVIGRGPQHLLSALTPPAEIEQIIITRPTHQGTETFFSHSVSNSIGRLSTDKVQSRINAKNERLTVYEQVAAEWWLIIGYDRLRISSSFTIPDDILEHVYESSFDKLFLGGLFLGGVHELQSTSPTS